MTGDQAPEGRPHVLFVCTGNAARSVMAATMTRARTDRVTVSGAGTHSIEGLPMSQRTRNALNQHGLRDPEHRSRQLSGADTDAADLVVVFEPNHISYVRRRHPDAAGRTAMLPRLARDLGPVGSVNRLAEHLASLALATQEPESWEEVIDPAGGDQATFDASAREISDHVDALIARFAW